MILVKKVLSRSSEQFVVMQRTKTRSYYYCGDHTLPGGALRRVWSLRRDKAVSYDHEREAHDAVERLRQHSVSFNAQSTGTFWDDGRILHARAA